MGSEIEVEAVKTGLYQDSMQSDQTVSINAPVGSCAVNTSLQGVKDAVQSGSKGLQKPQRRRSSKPGSEKKPPKAQADSDGSPKTTQKRGKSGTESEIVAKKPKVEKKSVSSGSTKAKNKSALSSSATKNIAAKRSIATQTEMPPPDIELHSNTLTIKICLCHPAMPSVHINQAPHRQDSNDV